MSLRAEDDMNNKVIMFYIRTGNDDVNVINVVMFQQMGHSTKVVTQRTHVCSI